MSLTENSNQAFNFLGLGIMIHSYIYFLKSLSAICIKCNVRYTDEQKYISQMSAIDLYDTINHLKFK